MAGIQVMKPAAFAEHQILTAILNHTYEPGDLLPGERALAQSLGVTRPTIRETLQGLAKEGWVTIAHGKPTRVNDYLADGGLGILTTLARYGDFLSHEMVVHLLRTREMLLPMAAALAAKKDPGPILAYLDDPLPRDGAAFARYDWDLQLIMVARAGNPVIRMVFNDFTPVFHLLGEAYFSLTEARAQSRDYYGRLRILFSARNKDAHCIQVRDLVAGAMADARKLWEKTRGREWGNGHGPDT